MSYFRVLLKPFLDRPRARHPYTRSRTRYTLVYRSRRIQIHLLSLAIHFVECFTCIIQIFCLSRPKRQAMKQDCRSWNGNFAKVSVQYRCSPTLYQRGSQTLGEARDLPYAGQDMFTSPPALKDYVTLAIICKPASNVVVFWSCSQPTDLTWTSTDYR